MGVVRLLLLGSFPAPPRWCHVIGSTETCISQVLLPTHFQSDSVSEVPGRKLDVWGKRSHIFPLHFFAWPSPGETACSPHIQLSGGKFWHLNPGTKTSSVCLSGPRAYSNFLLLLVSRLHVCLLFSFWFFLSTKEPIDTTDYRSSILEFWSLHFSIYVL